MVAVLLSSSLFQMSWRISANLGVPLEVPFGPWLEQRCFPRPVSLGSRAMGWVEAEVDEWMRERIAESRSNAE